MKEFINKLSMGMFDYEIPKIVIDIEGINETFRPGKIYEGSFKILNEGDGNLKGILYSATDYLKFKNNVFSGNNNRIQYYVDARYLEEGFVIKSEISIVSNGGELYIPVEITVQGMETITSMGEMKNLFHFANLVQQNYEEALHLFSSSSFEKLFLKEDLMLLTKYQGLIKGADKNLALEEFLVAANKKQPICLSVEKSEKSYENPQTMITDSIVVHKDTWGYLVAEIIVEGDFISLEKECITISDFEKNICEIPYSIDVAALREGYHFGTIFIRTLREEIKIPVRIHKKHENEEQIRSSRRLEYKKMEAKLYHKYLDFRMKKINLKIWADESLELIMEMRAIFDKSIFYKLVHTQLLLTKNREKEADKILMEVSKQFDEMEDAGHQMEVEYAYYLYVSSIKEKSEAYTRNSRERIQLMYEKSKNWKLLWMLFYLDEKFDRNESLKLTRLKEQFDEGMRSPLMYYETLAVFNNTPSLLRILDEFEYYVIAFGTKNRHISNLLAARITDLCANKKNFHQGTFDVLVQIYKMFKREDILENIVSMLIKSGKTESCFFKWYEKAVNAGMRITGLYEYYMYSIDYDYQKKLPDVILMYFIDNTKLKGERLDFLYQNIIEHKSENEKIYSLYYTRICEYAAYSISQGRVNDKLAIIYEEVLTPEFVTPDLAEKLPDILNTYMIECNNSQIKEVIVIHRELKEEERVPVISGKAYVRIFADDAAVVFEDVSGRRYLYTINYKMKKLLFLEDIQELCYELCPDNLGLLIHMCNKFFKYHKYVDKISEVMERLIATGNIRNIFAIFLQNELIAHYAAQGRENILKDYLEDIDIASLSQEAKNKIIELTILHGMNDRAMKLCKEFGCAYVKPQILYRMVRMEIEQTNAKENQDLVMFAMLVFRNKKYDESILNYLCRYYYGSTQDMYHIWEAVKNFQCESVEMEEKLLVQMLFTGEYENRMGTVFQSYISNGASDKVKKAYLIWKSYEYFVQESVIDEKLFSHIERELQNKEKIHYICELAYLKYCSEEENLNAVQISYCQNILIQMCERNKHYEFFKCFSKYFALPKQLENKTVFEYRTHPDSRVFIHYHIVENEHDIEKKDYIVKEMKNSCHGIFTFETILFYGEKMKYYITEERNKETKVTQSKEGIQSAQQNWQNDTIYGMLNNMMVCNEMQEEKTWKDLAVEFYTAKQLNNEIFKMHE